MGQEFIINSAAIESKINELLPSQGGYGAGIDFSASTTIIPIIDLTETASGSGLREDLQTSLSFKSVTSFDVNNTTSTLVTTTGYYRVFGVAYTLQVNGSEQNVKFILNDATTAKIIWNLQTVSTTNEAAFSTPFDFTVFLAAGDSLTSTASLYGNIIGCTRQIATISDVLVNPT
jgi:hypothetical protein